MAERRILGVLRLTLASFLRSDFAQDWAVKIKAAIDPWAQARRPFLAPVLPSFFAIRLTKSYLGALISNETQT